MNEVLLEKKPYRGFRLKRCEVCKVPFNSCICDSVPKIETISHIWLMMNEEELRKPTNTGHLITDSVVNSKMFLWQRTSPDQELIDLVNSQNYQPWLVFPADAPEHAHRATEFYKTDKPPAFILIDGTWNQARKIFRKSPYLDHLPMLSLSLDKKSKYLLRRASQDTHLCTAEVGIELLRLNEEFEACNKLETYFKKFIESYVSGRTNGVIKKQFDELHDKNELKLAD